MILELQNISKGFPSTTQGQPIEVLSDLNLSLNKGETLAILGHSGCGKSTLLSLIAGLDIPDSGNIILNGQNFQDLNEEKLTSFRAQQIGIVFQRFHLMPHLTALENVTLPLELNRQNNYLSKAKDLLCSIGLEHRLEHFPHQLSGGESQRVAIARALSIEPALLLADEPTGNLDEKTGENLSDLLFDLVASTGMTLLMVTHNNTLANLCRRKLQLKEGALHEIVV
ncbi:MAG: ABC transporter ATP-binding protein [Proteobacteria bacterium]|nr:ABC transporter ATP-binding protein [Pseudomonadota bacterium]